MLISTINNLRFFFKALFFVIIASTPFLLAEQQPSPLLSNVQNLGRGKNDFMIVEELAKTPRQSAELLINELHVVHETHILASEEQSDTEHVLWCIRALRYVTGGKDYCAKTAYHFGHSEMEQNRKYWVYFRHKNCVSFFAMWPSRGSEYIAPEDAQNCIIKKWRDWLAKEGPNYNYKPLQHPNPEDWLW